MWATQQDRRVWAKRLDCFRNAKSQRIAAADGGKSVKLGVIGSKNDGCRFGKLPGVRPGETLTIIEVGAVEVLNSDAFAARFK